MECPICKVKLLMTERQGIEIDYCPDCRGIWLDRGKLDKIIERSTSSENRTGQLLNENTQSHNSPKDSDNDDHQESRFGRKRSFFADLFD
jgi:Zn-finger nucleic acid-binding protein